MGQLPGISVEGPLKELSGKYVSEDATLYATADVGPRVNTGAGTMTLSVLVDGQTKGTAQQVCVSVDCTTKLPFRFQPADYPTGAHVVSVTATDATGSATSSWTVTVNHSVATKLTCTAAGQAVNFTVYSVGPVLEGLRRQFTDRECPADPDPGEAADGLRRPNYVSVIYGDCNDYEDGGCQPPLEIETWPACERNRASYYQSPEGDAMPRQDTTIRGVPAAWFEDGHRLEVYTGGVTVVIFGRDTWQMQQAALAMAPTAANPFTNPDQQTHVPDPTATLPAPLGGALTGKLAC